jgi:hypothetical protein
MSVERKADLEYKQLLKIGVPENMALLIVKHKYNADVKAVEETILDIKDEQDEIKNEISNFIELSKNLEFVEKEKNNNLISTLNINDKN